MSHGKLFKQGKISQQEYEAAEHLKRSGQKELYKLYEQKLEQREQQRREGEQRMEEAERKQQSRLVLTVRGHIRRAEATE